MPKPRFLPITRLQYATCPIQHKQKRTGVVLGGWMSSGPPQYYIEHHLIIETPNGPTDMPVSKEAYDILEVEQTLPIAYTVGIWSKRIRAKIAQ